MSTAGLKYFTVELVAAANDWVDQSERDGRKARNKFSRVVLQYRAELETLKPRISQAAWKFFRLGFGETGLHDGRLLSMTVGDGLGHIADGKRPFSRNAGRTSAALHFLNYEQNFHYSFDLRGVSEVRCDLFAYPLTDRLGDLYTYELTGVDERHLQLGFLFASDASIVVRFQRLVFRRTRLNRRYEVGDIYD